ncbi:MAG: diacylglycerol/lipid kinase family protein [Actinomycetota bacterium]
MDLNRLPRPPWRAPRETPLERFDRAADSGVLWGLAAAALGASQTRKGRRAGLRGLLNGVVAWVVATLVTRFTGHDARAQATAAAFTTGAALEAPAASLPAAAATITTVRRAEPGLLTGAALGAAVAFASKRIWPVPPDEGARAPEVSLPDHAEPNADGAGLFVAVNTASGNGDDGPADQLRRALPQAKVEEIEIVEGDELRKALDGAAEHAAVLGVSGGDGSINTAAQVAIEHNKPLAVFPTGTLNHLTGALGIEELDETVAALKKGEAVAVDVATIDGHAFLNTASFGSYVELVDMRERLEKRIGKWPAVVIALIRVLRKSEPVCIEIDGSEKNIWMAFIGNCRYSPSGFAPSWRKRLDDGQIDFRYVDGSAPWARLRLILAVLTGRLGRSKVYRQMVVDELRIRCVDGPMRLARDGETFEASSDEIVIEKLPERLAIYCPHEKIA